MLASKMMMHAESAASAIQVKANGYRKHMGYFCRKCQTDKRLTTMKLCDCLIFVEDFKKVRAHINREWVPIYADMGFKFSD